MDTGETIQIPQSTADVTREVEQEAKKLRIRNPADVDDWAQEILLAIWLRRFRGGSRKDWIRAVLRNRACDRWRKRQRHDAAVNDIRYKLEGRQAYGWR